MADGERQLNARFFGRFQAELDGQPLDDWPQRKTISLFQVLLLHRGETVPTDALVEWLYPDADPEKGRRTLYTRISELRRVLEPDLARPSESAHVVQDGEGYRLAAELHGWVDVEAFESHLHEASHLSETDRWSEALDRYEQALALYRGPFLAETPYEEWVIRRRQHYRDRYLDGLEQCAECRLRLGQHEAAVDAARQLVAQAPDRESGYRALMRARAQQGDTQKALQVYDQCARQLSSQGVEPTLETEELRDLIRRGKLPAPPQSVPHNLPANLTPFVGRATELEELAAQLDDADVRMLSLVGLGGIGKSRLARHAAARVHSRFSDGAWWVSLEDVTTRGEAIVRTAHAMGVSLHESDDPSEQLLAYLEGRELLLILDDVGDIEEAPDLIAELLRRAPHVTVLATARERLRLKGEWVHPVDGLRAPPEGTTEAIEAYDAVQLFVRCAKRADAAFDLNREDPTAVAEICRLVEGSPLGLELAAGWTDAMDSRAIADRLAEGLDLLETSLVDVAARHRSLWALFEQTWHTLPPNERRALRRLAIFRGGFTAEAANAVAGASVAELARLMDRFLLRRRGGRYEIHDLMRQFAHERLQQSAEWRETKARHAAYFTAFLRERGSTLNGDDPSTALDEIRLEQGNVRAAWEWAIQQDAVSHLDRALSSLSAFHDRRGWFQEGQALVDAALDGVHWLKERAPVLDSRLRGHAALFRYRRGRLDDARRQLETALQTLRTVQAPQEEAFVLGVLGIVAEGLGDYERAQRCHQAKRQRCREVDDRSGEAKALDDLGLVHWHLGDYEQAASLHRQALSRHQELGDRWSMAAALGNLGLIASAQGDHEAAQAHFQECLAISRELDAMGFVAISLNNLASEAEYLGNDRQAESLYQQAWEASSAIDDTHGVAQTLCNLGGVALKLGQPERARQLCQESVRLCREIGQDWQLAHALKRLGNAEAAMGNDRQAWQHLHEGLQTTTQLEATPLLLEVLLSMAEFYQQRDPQRAVEIASRVAHHPGCHAHVRKEAQALLHMMGHASLSENGLQKTERSVDELVSIALS